MSTSSCIINLAELIKSGDIAQAKSQAKTLVAEADPRDLKVIMQCAYVLETWPKIGIAKLRAYWRASNDHDRAIIAACAPEQNARRNRSTTPAQQEEPRWAGRAHEAPRDLRHEVRPELRRPARSAQAGDQDAAADAYQRERAGVDDAPEQEDQPSAYAIDYDRAALPPLSGTPCVRCWLERCRADQLRSQNDGLCVDCRDAGRPGIPSLPNGHTRADVVEARCAFIAATYPKPAIKLLRRYWQQSTRDDQKVIAEWVRHHDLTPQDEATGDTIQTAA